MLIIGTGFAGLAMALSLKAQNSTRFVILEQQHGPGGTWHDNRYPGCACDVPSHLYSLSAGPAWDWSRRYAGAPEIEAYLQQIAAHLTPHIRYGQSVTQAQWDDTRRLWVIHTTSHLFLAKVLIAATGPLSEPRHPDVPGIETFAGPIIHSARWPDQVNLADRSVALIGTGASALQIAPAIAAQVKSLTLFQRTAPWVVPRGDGMYTPAQRQRWLRWPWLRKAYRAQIYWTQEWRAAPFLHRTLMPWVERRTLRTMANHIHDTALLRKVTPTIPMGCQRILLSDDWWSTLQQPHVTLETDPLEQITASTLVTRQQRHYAADILILATGFRYQDNPMAERFIGLGGQTLAQFWQSQRGAFWGMMVPSHPNFFLLTGPFSGLGHNSIVFMIECQVAWIQRLLSWAQDHQRTRLQVRQSSYETFMIEMNLRSRKTVWMQGCHSWYLDAQGRNTALWPGYSLEYWWRLKKITGEDCIEA